MANRISTYIIPENFIKDGRIFNGLLKTRNFIEAIIMAAVVAVPLWVIPYPTVIAKLTVMISILLPIMFIGIVGINDSSVLEFLQQFLKWRKNKRIVLYNTNARSRDVRPAEVVLSQELPKDKLVKTLDMWREKKRRRIVDATFIEGEDFEFIDNEEYSSSYISTEKRILAQNDTDYTEEQQKTEKKKRRSAKDKKNNKVSDDAANSKDTINSEGSTDTNPTADTTETPDVAEPVADEKQPPVPSEQTQSEPEAVSEEAAAEETQEKADKKPIRIKTAKKSSASPKKKRAKDTDTAKKTASEAVEEKQPEPAEKERKQVQMPVLEEMQEIPTQESFAVNTNVHEDVSYIDIDNENEDVVELDEFEIVEE